MERIKLGMIVEILFGSIKDITKLYISKEVEDDVFGESTQIDYVAKDYCEKILSDVIGGFEEAKSLSYVGCKERIANEVFEFEMAENKYRVTFTIDTYGNCKARMKVKLEQIDPVKEYDFLLEQLKIAIKDKLICDWNRCIWVIDEQSETLCTKLYPMLFEVENEMRAFVNKVLIHCVGVNWIKNIGMEKYDLSHEHLKDDFRRISPRYAGVDDTLISMTLEIMMEIIKKGKIYDENIHMSSADWDTLNAKKNKTADAVLAYIKNKRKINVDMWEDIFKQYFESDLSTITDFIKNRNHVAHNKPLNWSSMQKIRKNVELLKSIIKIADRKFEESDMSEEIYMTIDAEQEMEREAEEAREWEEHYLINRIQHETGVEILDDNGIFDLFIDKLDNLYTEISDEYYFNPCFEVSEKYKIDNNYKQQILFSVKSNAIEKCEIEVVVNLCIDSAMDSDSTMYIIFRDAHKNENIFVNAEVVYHNGSGYEDSFEGVIVLESESELNDSELRVFIRELNKYIMEKLNPMIEKIQRLQGEDDDSLPVSTEKCYECDQVGISVDSDFYPVGYCCYCGTDNEE